jgi:AraC-like DNA-binding protein
MTFPVSPLLQPYIKGFMVFSTDRHLVNELFYPSGYVDFAVNISSGKVVTIINGRAVDMPKVEVLGQLTKPTRLTVTKGTTVLIARIFPFASALFFPNPVSDFTNHSIDLDDVLGAESTEFYDHLMCADSLEAKVGAFEAFLTRRLQQSLRIPDKTALIRQICRDLQLAGETFQLRGMAASYGISGRYIQKLFLHHVGLTPRAFFNIGRFNKSLQLIQAQSASLTSIAYECGYFDQAHFIRDFKKYTGLTPSEVRYNEAIESNF